MGKSTLTTNLNYLIFNKMPDIYKFEFARKKDH